MRQLADAVLLRLTGTRARDWDPRLPDSVPARVAGAYGEHDIAEHAAALAFNALLSVFPVLVGLAFLVDRVAARDQVVEAVGHGRRGDAVACAQAQLQCLDAAFLVGEDLLGRHRRRARRDGPDVALGGAHVPPPAAVRVRMGGATDAPVVALLPVQLVVAALVAGPGPVGDLVVGQPRRGQRVVHDRVLVSLVVVVRMAGRVGGERGPRLHGEGVGADVGRLQGQRGGDGVRPRRHTLPGAAVDEVDAERVEAGGPDRFNGGHHRTGLMIATKGGEHGRVHRLHTQGDASDARRPVRSKQCVVHRLRVALDGDLGGGQPLDAIEDRGEQVARHQRRRAAPDEHRRGRRESGGGDLGSARRRVLGHQVVAVGPRGERAVVAAPRAERDVDVDAEGPVAAGGRGVGQQGVGCIRTPLSSSRRRSDSGVVCSNRLSVLTSSARMVRTRPLKSWRCTWMEPR